MAWSDIIENRMCENYYCFRNNENSCIFNISDSKPNSKDQCIEKCITKTHSNNCNILQCQTRCLECKNENDTPYNKIERGEKCPWYKTLLDTPSAPDPPKIRAFSHLYENEPVIVLEWRKPHHNLSKIKNYIIEIKDLLYKNGIKVLTIPQEDKDIFQEKIKKLKPKTTYEICVRAIGEIKDDSTDVAFNNIILVGNKSNIITITTEGETNQTLSNIYNFFDVETNNDDYNQYQCNTLKSDHILNNINHDDINIYKSLQNL